MRRLVVIGVVLAGAVTLMAVGAVRQQPGIEAAVTRAPTQVEVTNLPAVQSVAGTVNVGNLPAVQNVAGGVQVTNLPVDEAGRVLVAVQGGGSNALTLRSTSATYQGDLGGRTGATQKCQAEFPGSHFVHVGELLAAAANGRPVIWHTSETQSSWMDDLSDGSNRNCQRWHVNSDEGYSESPVGWTLFPGGGSVGSPNPYGADHCTQTHAVLCAD